MLNVCKNVARKSFIQICAAGFLFLLAACTDYLPQVDAQIEEMREISNSSINIPSIKFDPSTIVEGSMKDSRDGKTYKTLTIGTKIWMAENLNYETANSFCYDNKSDNCAKYGRLYTWSAVMDSTGKWTENGKGCGYGKLCSPPESVQGVCPTEWRIPLQGEWFNLFMSAGGSGKDGKYLKSTSGWTSNNNGIDAFGFSALPAGYRNSNGDFYGEGKYAYFWSSSEDSYDNALGAYFYYRSDDVFPDPYNKSEAYSVRCIKDME